MTYLLKKKNENIYWDGDYFRTSSYLKTTNFSLQVSQTYICKCKNSLLWGQDKTYRVTYTMENVTVPGAALFCFQMYHQRQLHKFGGCASGWNSRTACYNYSIADA